MARRAFSTVLGTLLFVIIASMFLALMFKAFNDFASAIAELSANNQRQPAIEQLQITVNYTRRRTEPASTSAQVQVLAGQLEGDVSLLDAKDGRSLNVTSISTGAGGGGGGGGGGTQIELVRNGDFSQGSAYWTMEPPWTVDLALQCARIYTWALTIDARLWQDVTVPDGTSSLTLSFYYYMWAFPSGWVRTLSITVSIISGGTVVWSDTIDWVTNPTQGTYQSAPIQLAPGTYRLEFRAIAEARGIFTPLFDIRVDDVSLLATLAAPPPPSPTTAAYLAAARLTFNSGTYGTDSILWLALNETGFVEVYEMYGNGVWKLAGRFYASGGSWFNVSLTQSDVVVYAYASDAFKVMMDYLEVGVVESGLANVTVANVGAEPVEVYAVWLRNSTWESRVEEYRLLEPGDLAVYRFQTYLTPGVVYEARVVTATKTHYVRFRP